MAKAEIFEGNLQKIINNITELDQFTKEIASNINKPELFLLDGSLGVGKTAFAKSLIGNIASKFGSSAVNVPSPSFTLVNCYQFADFNIAHFDLFRLYQKPNFYEQLVNIDFFELIHSHFCLVEWPEKAIEFLTEARNCLFHKINIGFHYQNRQNFSDLSIDLADLSIDLDSESSRIINFSHDFAKKFLQ